MSTAIALLETTPQSTYSDAEKLGAEITELCSYIYAVESCLLSLIREFDEKGYWAQQGLFSCAHWLNFKCGVGMNAAREKLRAAHALAKLPKISERFEKGQLSYSKVRAITRIADSSNEEYLLMIADHGTAHHVEKLVSKYRTAKRLQDVDIVRAQHNNREVTHYYDHDGCLVIKARLPGEQGALIVKALEMAMDVRFHDKDVCPKGTWTAVTSSIEDGPGVTADMLIRLSSVDTRCSVLACRCRTQSSLPKHSIPQNLYVNSRADLALRRIVKNFFSGFDIRTDLSVRGALLSVAGHSMAND